ncbi:MAG: hypothetical protein HYS24_05745 [Ignavibacteriales bacterium]|jgi:predicted membrane protein|nr:hypothetical protein [Ignavibacteriales bacterium]MBK7980358.1 hypothetical protein [Ignavibacteriota bacterium]
MNTPGNNTTARIILGAILVVLGTLFLLDNYGFLNFSLPNVIFEWEYILIGIGIYLLTTSKNKTAGIILLTIGLFNLIPEFWPLILVALGIYIILKRNPAKQVNNLQVELDADGKEINSSQTINSNYNNSVDDVSIFGGGTKRIASTNFTGGKLTAIFGGSDIHLENCLLAKGKNDLDIFAMFGGYTIYVPQDWNVIIDVVPIFGGFSDKRIKDPNRVYEEDKILVIRGLVLFGGGEVKF